MFIDTATIAQIKAGFTLGVLNGVTTNPSILLKEGKRRRSIIKDILQVS